MLSHAELDRQLTERQELYNALREKIDRVPAGSERELLIDALLSVDREIEELLRDNDPCYSP